MVYVITYKGQMKALEIHDIYLQNRECELQKKEHSY